MVFIVMVITEVVIGHTRQFYTYNHGGQKISLPRFPQEAIPRGVHGENFHEGLPHYSYPSMPPHPHHNMPYVGFKG